MPPRLRQFANKFAPRFVIGMCTAFGVACAIVLDFGFYGTDGIMLGLISKIQRGLLVGFEAEIATVQISWTLFTIMVLVGLFVPLFTPEKIKTPLSGFLRGVSAMAVVLMILPKAPSGNQNLMIPTPVGQSSLHGEQPQAAPPQGSLDGDSSLNSAAVNNRKGLGIARQIGSRYFSSIAFAKESAGTSRIEPVDLVLVLIRISTPKGYKFLRAKVTVLNRDKREIIASGSISIPEFRFLALPHRHKIVIESPGFKLTSKDIRVFPSKPQSLSITLSPP